jgi:hypothetical protein
MNARKSTGNFAAFSTNLPSSKITKRPPTSTMNSERRTTIMASNKDGKENESTSSTDSELISTILNSGSGLI